MLPSVLSAQFRAFPDTPLAALMNQNESKSATRSLNVLN